MRAVRAADPYNRPTIFGRVSPGERLAHVVSGFIPDMRSTLGIRMWPAASALALRHPGRIAVALPIHNPVSIDLLRAKNSHS
jgi:hypothetical protein